VTPIPTRKTLRINLFHNTFPTQTSVPDGFLGLRAAALDPVSVPPP